MNEYKIGQRLINRANGRAYRITNVRGELFDPGNPHAEGNQVQLDNDKWLSISKLSNFRICTECPPEVNQDYGRKQNTVPDAGSAVAASDRSAKVTGRRGRRSRK